MVRETREDGLQDGWPTSFRGGGDDDRGIRAESGETREVGLQGARGAPSLPGLYTRQGWGKDKRRDDIDTYECLSAQGPSPTLREYPKDGGSMPWRFAYG